MRHLGALWAILTALMMVSTSQAGLTVSLGVREAGGTGPIGANGGSSGGIEWIQLDAQSFAFDNSWHTLTWQLDGTNASAFAGTTADGNLTGTWGTIEHLRLLNSDGMTGPVTIYIDNFVVTTPSGATTLTDFEGFALGQEVMFRQPGFSGSTSANLVAGSTVGITDSVARSGTGSLEANFQFVDGATNRWIRLTTFNTATLGNPAIPFGNGNSLSVSFRAVPEPSSLALLGFGVIGLLQRRRR